MGYRSTASIVAAVLTVSCTVIVEGELENKPSARDGGPDGGGAVDSGPIGPACDTTEQCLQLDVFNCRQRCVDRVCVVDDADPTPDGVACGQDDSEICVAGRCVTRECGDGFVDREASPPEFCDDGNTSETDSCNNQCTRQCTPPAPAVCTDGNPCNGIEECDSGGTGLCRVMPPPPDGAMCTIGVDPGTCQGGACVAD